MNAISNSTKNTYIKKRINIQKITEMLIKDAAAAQEDNNAPDFKNDYDGPVEKISPLTSASTKNDETSPIEVKLFD
jgi:hypothetical protein